MLLLQIISGVVQSFPETLEMHDFSFSQEAQWREHIGVIRQVDEIFVGAARFLLPEEILMAHEANTIRIPMLEAARSLNLSNSVAIIIYEAMRQQGFPGMLMEGQLHHHKW